MPNSADSIMPSNIYIDNSASISPNVKIGSGTKVWINTQVRENAKIGANCVISKDVYIDKNVEIGDRCKIQNGVSIYDGVIISNDVFIGPDAIFTNDKVPRAFNAEWKVTPTYVREGASIGANATIVCGIEVGKYAMIAAGAVVTKNVAEYDLVMGNPAKVVGKVNRLGERVK